MNSQQKPELALAVALYAQVTGLSRFAIRQNPALQRKALEHRAASMAAARAARLAR